MVYAQLDGDGRIIAITQTNENPNVDIWDEVELPEMYLEDFNDYLLVDGELVHDPLVRQPIPLTTEEAIAAIVEAQQETLVPLLPDSVVERMESFFQEWDGDGHAYATGNIVSHGYILYRCVQPHTSQPDWTPDTAVSLWAKLLTSDEPQPWEQPDSTNPYMKGDRVTHNGHTWVSDVDNNVWEPGVYGWTRED